MQNSYERWKRQEQINFFVGFQVAQWFTALTQTGFIIVQLVGPWELFKFNEILIVCPSSVCLSLCLSGFANFCAHFYGSGAASPVCLSVWKALAPKGLCTLFQPSKIMNLFHRSLKQVVNLSCLKGNQIKKRHFRLWRFYFWNVNKTNRNELVQTKKPNKNSFFIQFVY